MEHLMDANPENPTLLVRDTLAASLADRFIGLVLFGSRARGDHSDLSDWDLLLVAEGLPERVFARNCFLVAALPPKLRGSVSIIARTPAEFAIQSSTLYLEIAATGQILHDPTGMVEARLSALREWASKAGWKRVQDGPDSYWLSDDHRPLAWLKKGA